MLAPDQAHWQCDKRRRRPAPTVDPTTVTSKRFELAGSISMSMTVRSLTAKPVIAICSKVGVADWALVER